MRSLPFLAGGLLLACSAAQANGPDVQAPTTSTVAPSAAAPNTEVDDSSPDSEWWTRGTPCPAGAELKGAAPPAGKAVWCEKDGRPHGPKTTFFPSGQREATRTYYQGKALGRFVVWNESGTLAEEGRYRNDALEGHYVRHYKSGAKELEGDFHAGKQNGPFKKLAETGGVLLEEVQYREGLRHGMARVFFDTGKLKEETEYASGLKHGASRTFYENGQQRSAGKYDSDKQVGVWRSWRENGMPLEERHYVAGMKEGTAIRWQKNGAKEFEGAYKGDEMDGPFNYFDGDTNLIKTEQYQNGRLVSTKKFPKKNKPKP
jgi:antitoxin component YwqK of YwqJK toxin-antitoxin module